MDKPEIHDFYIYKLTYPDPSCSDTLLSTIYAYPLAAALSSVFVLAGKTSRWAGAQYSPRCRLTPHGWQKTLTLNCFCYVCAQSAHCAPIRRQDQEGNMQFLQQA